MPRSHSGKFLRQISVNSMDSSFFFVFRFLHNLPRQQADVQNYRQYSLRGRTFVSKSYYLLVLSKFVRYSSLFSTGSSFVVEDSSKIAFILPYL